MSGFARIFQRHVPIIPVSDLATLYLANRKELIAIACTGTKSYHNSHMHRKIGRNIHTIQAFHMYKIAIRSLDEKVDKLLVKVQQY
jgi:hypothetical protein